MDLYACVVLLLVQDNILVAVDTLVEEDSLVVESNLEEGNLVVAHIPAVDTLEVVFAALLCRTVVAHVDQD